MKNLSIKLLRLGDQLYEVFITINILCAFEQWPLIMWHCVVKRREKQICELLLTKLKYQENREGCKSECTLQIKYVIRMKWPLNRVLGKRGFSVFVYH